MKHIRFVADHEPAARFQSRKDGTDGSPPIEGMMQRFVDHKTVYSGMALMYSFHALTAQIRRFAHSISSGAMDVPVTR
jgi:hypothetical protein